MASRKELVEALRVRSCSAATRDKIKILDEFVSLLARTFAIPRKALADGLRKTDGGSQMHDRLRFCTACMALAHHGVMHQRVGASRCPCHGVLLEEHCRGCGAAATYRLNARLLGSPLS